MAQPYGMALCCRRSMPATKRASTGVIGGQGAWCTTSFPCPACCWTLSSRKSGQVLAQWANEILSTGMQTVMLAATTASPVLDLKGLLPEERIQGLIDTLVKRGGFVKGTSTAPRTSITR